MVVEVIFWVALGLLAWFFVFYPALIGLLSLGVNREADVVCDQYPEISIIIAAYNEEDTIRDRIIDCLNQKYPSDKMEVIVGSDGSTDNTVSEARSVESDRVKVINCERNRGRSQVHNDCVRVASGQILFFTDADTRYVEGCLQKMVRHYKDEQIGCVGGELRSVSFHEGGIGGGQGIYWRYEYAVRKWQSDLGVLTKVSGANMCMRRSLYRPLPEDIDVDQAAGMLTQDAGYKTVHEPEAIALENFPTSLGGEFEARVRFVTRALTALSRFSHVMCPLRRPLLALNVFSYRVVRYLMPFLLIAAFCANIILLGASIVYDGVFLIQLAGYSLATVGFVLDRFHREYWLFSLPLSFVWFNVGIFTGVLQFSLGKRLRSYR